MIIAIITLSVVVLMMGLIIVGYDRALKAAINDKFNIKLYPCNLLLTMHYNAEKTMTITDFSRYETAKIISHTVYVTGPPPDEQAKLVDGVTAAVSPAAIQEIAEGVFTCIL